MSQLSSANRIYTEAEGVAFAGEYADVTDYTFEAALNKAMSVIKQVLEQDGAEPTLAAKAAAVFSRSAIAERRRVFLVATEPAGSA